MSFLEKDRLHEQLHLEFLANQVVEGFIIGLHKSPFHGFSVEFAEHRIYNPGESTRNIDWKVYARTDRLYTKRFEEETNLRCQIVLDASSSMFFPYVKQPDLQNPGNKFVFSSLAASALMVMLRKQRDAFGLTLFDQDIRFHSAIKSSTSHYKMLLQHLEGAFLENPLSRSTRAAETLHILADKIHRRSLVILFSDMFENMDQEEELFQALRHLKHNKHEVILFHTVDQAREVMFDFPDRPYEFIDMESGESVKVQAGQVREYYVRQMSLYIRHLRERCLQYRIDFVEADIQKGYRQILLPYLVKRKRMNA
jgi:uncharacterized protein (DUF58 family)